MKVSEIARELGARQVVYIDLASCGVEQAGGDDARDYVIPREGD